MESHITHIVYTTNSHNGFWNGVDRSGFPADIKKREINFMKFVDSRSGLGLISMYE